MKVFHKIIFLSTLLAAFPLCAQESVSLSLEQCREMALQSSEKVQNAQISVQQAELDKQVAHTGYLPKLDGSANSFYAFPDKSLGSDGFQLLMKGTYMAGLSIQQPLYAGGKIITGNKQASLGIDMRKENERLERQQLRYDTDNAYWTYVAVCSKVDLMRAYVRQLDSLYKDEALRVAQEMQTEADLLRIDSKRSQIGYQMQKAVNGMEICRMSLCHYVGLPLNTLIIAADSANLGDDSEVETAGDISNRPEYVLLKQQVDLSKLDVKMTRADYLPTLGLGLSYNWYGNIKLKMSGQDESGAPYTTTSKFSGNGGMVALSLSIPIYHFGEGTKKVRRAQLAVRSKQLALDENIRLLNIEREQAFRNLNDSRTMIVTAERSMSQSQENLRVSRLRFNENLCTLTDLLDAQTQWQESRSNLIEAQAQFRINQTSYRKAAGLLD